MLELTKIKKLRFIFLFRYLYLRKIPLIYSLGSITNLFKIAI